MSRTFWMRTAPPGGWGPNRQVLPDGLRFREIRGNGVAQFWRDMFQVSVEESFSAGHALRGYRGKCENVHGHNYVVRVTLEGPKRWFNGFVVGLAKSMGVMREFM